MTNRDGQKRIGIFGGTFDPVHMGHLIVARKLLNEFSISTILFIPALVPPHKSQPVADYFHRIAMLEDALASETGMSVSSIESERTTPSYTIDTILELKKRMGQQNLFFIIGSDAFLELHLWHRYKDLLSETFFIVVARPGIAMNKLHTEIERLPGDYKYYPEKRLWKRSDSCVIYYFAGVYETVSSTRVRDMLKQGKDVSDILPEKVYSYIKKHQLYGARGVAGPFDNQ